jgi:abortive infection bacteriophage resistance protein
MANKTPYSIADQIALLKHRGMLFNDEQSARHFLENISYYRLKGYWWDMQKDPTTHFLKPDTYFEDVIERYNFDRRLRPNQRKTAEPTRTIVLPNSWAKM